MNAIQKIADRYAGFVSSKPWTVLAIALLFFVLAGLSASHLQFSTFQNKDILPDGQPAVEALQVINDEFGGAEFATLVVQVDPQSANSTEPRDARDPQVMKYVHALGAFAKTDDCVQRVDSATTAYQDRFGGLPKTTQDVIDAQKMVPGINGYLNPSYSLATIRIQTLESCESGEVYSTMTTLLKENPAPPGVTAHVAGASLAFASIEPLISKDSNFTSIISMAAIIAILVLIFGSLRRGLIPLTTIVFGLVWGMGFVAFIGLKITPLTAGVMSMIMGIGIDFGIQVITRFKYEFNAANPEAAMHTTLSHVLIPMTTTTLAAAIGFAAMNLGTLTMMGQLGQMMAYGVTASFLAAITAVPALTIIEARIRAKQPAWR
ncbi:MMPL family transporter [Candidatus Micrarchaeota archaeon]|nr:MMPL family transporter [Candidatus Micrarchaeota archaeon]